MDSIVFGPLRWCVWSFRLSSPLRLPHLNFLFVCLFVPHGTGGTQEKGYPPGMPNYIKHSGGIPFSQIKQLIRFRTGAHHLRVETERWVPAPARLPRSERVCQKCTLGSVMLISRTFTLTALQRWYAFKQLSGWGLDQALTKQQQDERSTLKPRFLELKTAGAFPRWHGSEIFVRVQAGVRPATQWNPAQCVPPRPRANPAATAPGAAAAPTAAGPRPTGPTRVRNPSPAREGVSPAAVPGSSAAAGPSAATAAAGTAGAGPAAPPAAGASGSNGPFPPPPPGAVPPQAAAPKSKLA